MSEHRFRSTRIENATTGQALTVTLDLNKIEHVSYLETVHGERLSVRFDSGVTDEYEGKDAKQVYEELLKGLQARSIG